MMRARGGSARQLWCRRRFVVSPCAGLLLWLGTCAFPAQAASVVSDEFNSASLNATLWTFINPLNDATLAMTGSALSIAVPGGQDHDIWRTGWMSPRVMQNIDDTDFEIESRFNSDLVERFQLQGFVIQDQEGTPTLRIEFHTDGLSTILFAASLIDGDPVFRISKIIPSANPMYLRVKRDQDRWTASYAYSRDKWYLGGTFDHAFQVSAVGAMVGNSGDDSTNAPAPAYTGLIDYFYNTAALPGGVITPPPPVDEPPPSGDDGSSSGDTDPPPDIQPPGDGDVPGDGDTPDDNQPPGDDGDQDGGSNPPEDPITGGEDSTSNGAPVGVAGGFCGGGLAQSLIGLVGGLTLLRCSTRRRR